MSDARRPENHHCAPETGAIEGTLFFSSKSRSWVMTVVPTGGPTRHQRMDVRFCPWCGRDLDGVAPEEGAELVE